jgi:hypothetical protein
MANDLTARWVVVPAGLVDSSHAVSAPPAASEGQGDGQRVRLRVVILPIADGLAKNADGIVTGGAGPFADWPAKLATLEGFKVTITDAGGNDKMTGIIGRVAPPAVMGHSDAWKALFFPPPDKDSNKLRLTHTQPNHPVPFGTYPSRRIASALKSVAVRYSLRKLIPDIQALQDNLSESITSHLKAKLETVQIRSAKPGPDTTLSLKVLGTGLDTDLAGILWSGSRRRRPRNHNTTQNEIGTPQDMHVGLSILEDLDTVNDAITGDDQGHERLLQMQMELLAISTGENSKTVAANFIRNAALRAMRSHYRLELSPILEATYQKDDPAGDAINLQLQSCLSKLGRRLYGPRPVSKTPFPRPHAADFMRLYAFHKRASFTRAATDNHTSQTGDAQAVLNMVTHLQNYPKLLGSLGLVLDVGIDVDSNSRRILRSDIVNAVGGALPCHGTIKVDPIWSTGSDPDSKCYTRFNIAESIRTDGNKWSFRADDPIVTDGRPRGSMTDASAPSESGPGIAWMKGGYLNLLAADNRYLKSGSDVAGRFSNADRKFHLEILDPDHGGLALSLLARALRDRPRVMAITAPPPIVRDLAQTAAQMRSAQPGYVSNAFTGFVPAAPPSGQGLSTICLGIYDAQRLARVVVEARAGAYKSRSDRVTVPEVQVLFSVDGPRAFTADVDICLSQGRVIALVWNAIQLQGIGALDTDSPPAHNSKGISLLWSGRDQDMAQTVARDLSGKVAGAGSVYLDAGDLILGFVPYVRVIGGRKQSPRGSKNPAPPVWVSLCQRRENYNQILAGLADTVVDMPLRMSATKPLDTATPPSDNGPQPADIEERLLGEPLFGWQGESLALPKSVQGVTLVDQQKAKASGDAATPKVVPVTAVPVPTRRLRFSRPYAADKLIQNSVPVPFEFRPIDGAKYRLLHYRFCVAIMDRSGQVRDPNKDADETLPALETPYLRYQPIPAPVLLLDSKRRGLSRVKTSLNEMVVGGWTSEERWGVPKRVDEQMCETHGVLDSDQWFGRSFNAVNFTKDKLEFPPDPASQLPVRQPGLPMDEIPAPYFPDPMVRRIGWWVEGLGETLIEAHEAGGALDLYPSGATWPEACAISFRLVETTKSTMIARGHSGSSVREIALPPGWRATLYVCGLPDADDLSSLGFATMAEFHELQVLGVNHLDPAHKDNDSNFTSAIEKTRTGRHPRITPAQAINLVHAVAKPLTPPVFAQSPSATILLGETKAALSGIVVTVDEKSTGRVDFQAQWKELVDYPGMNSPPVLENHQASIEGMALPPATLTGLTDIPFETLTQTFTAPAPRRAARYRRINYVARAQSRFRDYYSRTKAETDFVLDSEPVPVDIRNSVPPDAPSVRYHAPAFQWSVAKTQKDFWGNPRKFESFRRNVIRVYMERGWGTAGEGERVAVVVPPKGYQSGPYDRYVTRWGRDPTRRTPLMPMTNMGPSVDDFFLTVKDKPTASIAQEPNGLMPEFPFDLALYEPHFDERENLWCCDIGLDLTPPKSRSGEPRPRPEDYGLFVKVVLVRYQEQSLREARLSSPVLLDFARLYPDRSVAVSRANHRRNSIRIEIFGTAEATTANDKVKYDYEIEVYHLQDPGKSTPIWEQDEDEFTRVPLTPRDPQGQLNSTNISAGAIWGCFLDFHRPVIERRMVIVKEMEKFGGGSRTIYADALQFGPENL